MGGEHRQHAPETSSSRDLVSALASSFRSSAPIAEEALARDLAACSDSDSPADNDAVDTASESSEEAAPGPTLYRRPSGVAYGTSRPTMNPRLELAVEPVLSRVEKKQSRDAERSLLRDNHVLPPKHNVERHPSLAWRMYRSLFSTKVRRPVDEETPETGVTEESSPLLRGASPTGDGHEHLNERWEAAVAAGKLRTTWQRETKTIAAYAAPLIVTFLLQYSINVTSIFAVGRIGKMELGAVSLATMTGVITCYAPFQGLVTSLDTLCAQAYGSGHWHLVGLQFQRMTYFLLLCFVPIGLLWWHGETILAAIIPEARSAELAGQYLRVLILGGPGFACFEGGKRFVQAQGLFQATTYVLFIAAPINVLLSWLFVWRLEWGFIGAPTAVVITQNLMPLLLFLYVRFVNGYQCWGGFSRRALTNWGVMIRLALPGMIMVEAEYLAFELLTLFSSRFGAEYLAAQSVVITLTAITFQIPFSLSIAASTRLANLIGAGLINAAKTTAKLSVVAAALVGLFNFVLFAGLRFQLPLLFTKDPDVVSIVAEVMPLCAVMQLVDSMSAGSHGLLRGIGRQSIGGYVNLLTYYLFAVPVSFGTAFGLGWKLEGLWLGVTLGLLVVAVIEHWFVYVSDWDKAARDAETRNAAG